MAYFLNRIFQLFTTFIICIVGGVIGLVTGAMKGQRTETGFVRGAGVGAITGAIVALEATDLIANCQPISKVALSLIRGKLILEWTSAWEWSFTDVYNMENTVQARGLSEQVIAELPVCVFDGLSKTCQGEETCKETCKETQCVICLQDFQEEEEGRELPGCGHLFHVKCIDEWLVRQGSCPVCRREVTTD